MTYASNDSGYPFGHPESFVGDSPNPKLAAAAGQLNTPKAWLYPCHKFAVPLSCDMDGAQLPVPLKIPNVWDFANTVVGSERDGIINPKRGRGPLGDLR